MPSSNNTEDRDFHQANEDWHLDRLLQDIHTTTQEPLTPREQTILRGLLSDYSPQEIALISFNKTTSKTISSDLTRIYDRTDLLLLQKINHTGKTTSDNIRRLLQKAGYRK